MPFMIYQDYIGQEYKFNKGERVPQWLYKGNSMFFGTDTLVIPLKNKVYIMGNPIKDESLIICKSVNGEHITQVCPMISFRTGYTFLD